MSEQDHASLRDKQRRAIFEVMPNAEPADVERLVGALAEIREEVGAVFARYRQRSLLDCAKDLSEFVRGIVREEIRPNLAACPAWCPCRHRRCTCPWFATAPELLDCPVHGGGRKQPCTCTIVPASNCPTHGVLKNDAHTKTASHHHHDSLGSGGFICSLDDCAPNTCTDPHEEFHYPK